MFITKVFNYLEPIWCSGDGKPSIRRLLSLFFSIVFTILALNKSTQSEVLWAVGTLIASLLSLTTFQNIKGTTEYNNSKDGKQ